MDPKRRKELALIGVGALVVLVALYLTFRPRAKPAAATPPVASAVVQPAAQPQAPSPQEPGPGLIESGAATTPGRDPFRPVVLAQAPGATAPPAPPMGGIDPLPVPWLLQGSEPGANLPTSQDRLRLAGIVQGEPPVAVLRQGSKRYFVTIGDPVDSEYIVRSISDRRVVLAKGEGTLSLIIGGRM